MTQTDSLSRKIAERIRDRITASRFIGCLGEREMTTIEQIIASELAEREKAVKAAIRAAERLLKNGYDGSGGHFIVNMEDKKALRAALSGLGVTK